MPTLYDVAHFCSWNGYTEDMQSYLGVDTASWKNREFWSPHGANLLYGPDKKSRIQIICENGLYYDFKDIDSNESLTNKYDAVSRIRELIADGAKPDIKDANGWSGLLRCACNGWSNHLDIMKILLDAGADINQASDRYGFTPLTLSAANGHTEIVKELIRRGAIVNLASNDCKTPITHAAQGGHLNIVKQLIAAGTTITNQAFEGAIRGGHIRVLKFLVTVVKPPADSVFYATYYKKTNTIKVLAKGGANMNADFPVHLAISDWNNDCLAALCVNGANLNILDEENRTPLRHAIHMGNHEAISILVKYKADINNTPLIHYAIQMYNSFSGKERKRCLLEIIKAGPNFNLLDQEGNTPAEYAHNKGLLEFVSLIKIAELKQSFSLSGQNATSSQLHKIEQS